MMIYMSKWVVEIKYDLIMERMGCACVIGNGDLNYIFDACCGVIEPL